MLATRAPEPEEQDPERSGSDAARAAVAAPGPESWWDEARCNDQNGTLVSLFFSEELQDIARAKDICAKCPVLAECLEGALERREPWGVWGGQMFLNGKILLSKRRRGRPPKVPRPEDHLPEVPIPEHLQDPRHLRSA